MVLSEEKKSKLDNLTVEEMAVKKNFIKTANKYIDVSKVLRGEEKEENFGYEYDDLFEEWEQIVPISLDEFKSIAPKIYKKIGETDSKKIFKAIEGENKVLTDNLVKNSMVKEMIKKIQRGKTSEKTKKEKIADRKAMYEEGKKLKKEGVELNKSLAWDIWFIEEGKRKKARLLERYSKEKYDEMVETVKYLGEEFMKDLKHERDLQNGWIDEDDD